MQINCSAINVYSENGCNNKIDVEIEVDTKEADVIFEDIKEYVDHDDMMRCLNEDEVLAFFNIEEPA